MITRRIFGGLLLGGMALVVSGCDALVRPSTEARYRLTVEVETPQGINSGSSVIQMRAVSNPEWMRQSSGRTGAISFKGEAVAVDLGKGKTLFALLRGETNDVTPFTFLRVAQAVDMADYGDARAMLERMGRGRDVRILPPKMETGCADALNCSISAYPLLVTFKDIKDPTSVERVDPDNLEASFGKGYRLKAITVQVTDEEVTTGIEKRLGWLKSIGLERGTLKSNPPKYLDEVTDPIQLVGPNSFSTELFE